MSGSTISAATLSTGSGTLRRTPGFTIVAMLTLALSIGAVAVIYNVLRNVVLDPFPYSRSDRMVNLVLNDASGRGLRGPYYSAQEFLDYQEQADVFEDVVGRRSVIDCCACLLGPGATGRQS
ncbi:MAG TPA: hypothetical protein VFT39_25145 [Vicinamibacterales bacterium]|nr:hypothetical protein [Vicinamibacterales bacterium]